eukprot:CAMPEP_0194065288 /NCGR_PEP_ID=MMETSP0009_2-20130614/85341_1 /TAXON_ID=210454 /ORGANISM="Grammatophora oceanica, Strain CCMP 410" /LENGTH=147 /DNA_ID=CAMNT_0038718093 /DNA_START=69 /DNA_END=510 /DNA_ORIENTATION=+
MASVSSSDRNEANHCLGADDLAGYAGHGDDNLVVDDSDDLGRDRLDGLVGYDVCHDDESGNGLEDTGLGDDESTYSAGETKKVQKHSFVSVDVGCDGREEDVDDIDEAMDADITQRLQLPGIFPLLSSSTSENRTHITASHLHLQRV